MWSIMALQTELELKSCLVDSHPEALASPLSLTQNLINRNNYPKIIIMCY